jgi:hypothetical protein
MIFFSIGRPALEYTRVTSGEAPLLEEHAGPIYAIYLERGNGLAFINLHFCSTTPSNK